MSTGGFILGGKTARELGMVMLRESQRPILPSTIDRTLTIPGRHGAWDFGAELGPRQFNLECAFVTKNPVELQQKITELAAFLVDSSGRPRNLELEFDTRPGQKFIVRYSGFLPIERIAGLGRFTLPLVAYDPFAYGDQREKIIAARRADFARNSAAYKSDGTQVSENVPRFETVGGRTGVLVEEATTNLLTANQSSVETDTSGFQAAPAGTSISRDTSKAWNGSASLKVVADGSASYQGFQTPHINVYASTTYTFSVYLSGNGTVRLIVYFYDSSDTYISGSNGSNISLDQNWKRAVLTFTTPSNAAKVRLRVETPSAQAITFWADGLQLEQKPYATSWVLGGTTRASETLTVPTAGVLQPQEGTIEFIFTPTTPAASTSYGRCFNWGGGVTNPITKNDFRIVWGTGFGLNKILFEIADKDTRTSTSVSVTLSQNIQVGSWYYLAARWVLPGYIRLTVYDYTTGEVKTAQTNTNLAPDFNIDGSAYLGTYVGNTGYVNWIFDYIRISNRARTDQEIAAAYQNGVTVDEDTTAYFPFDSTLENSAPSMIYDGTVETPFEAEITLKQNAPELIITNGEKQVRLIWNFVQGDVVRLDFDKRKIHINGNLRMTSLDILESEFFTLAPGENTIEVTPSSTTKVIYRPRWL